MARYQYVILTQAVQGMQDEFERWYDEVHLKDVLKVPGIVSAKRYRIVRLQAEDLGAPLWCSLAVYEMETDDPDQVLARIRALAGTEAMPLTDALNRSGMVQVVAQSMAV
jgi:hypothetical protein